jgi:curved DNA-binding protein
MAKRDYYDILGVSKSATPDEIKKAHRKLVRQYHPDVNKDNAQATERFKEVQEAYDVLSDEQKRRNYDQFGHAGVGAGAGPGGPGAGGDPFEAFRRAQQSRGRTRQWNPGGGVTVEDFDLNDLGGNGGFADIFEQMFGGSGGAGRRGAGGAAGGRQRAGRAPTPERGNDIEYPVTLSFEDAARGTSLSLQAQRGGKTETIDVKIPAGVKDGSRIRVRGQGDRSVTGGEHGDLYIIVSVRPHPFFRRDGLDVLLDVPISLYESLLGTKVEVPTLDGSVTITVPPGTGSHAKLRIKGRGIQRGGDKGDQFCVIRVVVPRELDEPEKDQVRAMQHKHPLDARADVPWKAP